jgi:hypothetical protein
MGEMRNAYELFDKRLKGRDHFQDLGVDGRKILDLKKVL